MNLVVGQNVDRQNVERHNVEQTKCRTDKTDVCICIMYIEFGYSNAYNIEFTILQSGLMFYRRQLLWGGGLHIANWHRAQ